MRELMSFVGEWWLAAVIGLLACYGIGALWGETTYRVRAWLWGERPKPKLYRVIIQDHDEWPMRSYSLTSDAIGRLVSQLDRDRDREREKTSDKNV